MWVKYTWGDNYQLFVEYTTTALAVQGVAVHIHHDLVGAADCVLSAFR